MDVGTLRGFNGLVDGFGTSESNGLVDGWGISGSSGLVEGLGKDALSSEAPKVVLVRKLWLDPPTRPPVWLEPPTFPPV